MIEMTRRDALATGGLALLAPAMPATAIIPRAPARRRERLARWRFHLGHAADQELDFGFGRNQRTFAKAGATTADAAMIGFDDSGWDAVQLPHDWAVVLPFAKPAMPAPNDSEDAAAAHGFKAIGRAHPGNSIGWYRCPVAVTAADRGRRLWLEFDGVFRDCLVFVNGHIVGRNESGYAPFRVSIDDFLDYDGGGNLVTVRVDATLGEGWFYEGAGIYRHVELVRADPVHVPQWGVVVRSDIGADGAGVTAATEVFNSGDSPAAGVLRQWVTGPDGKQVASLPDAPFRLAAGERRTIAGEARIAAPQLWSVDAPNLYRLRSEVRLGDRLVDEVETRFGIRTLRFDAQRGFLLNGRSLGRKPMPRNGHLAWSVPYAPGRIEARGFNGGRRVARAVRETAGAAAAVRLTADKRLAKADGADVVMLCAEVVDAKGRPVPDAVNLLRFAAQGDAEIIGVGNGDPTSLERDVAAERRAFQGLAQAILRVGDRPGPILAAVTADGLKGDTLRLVAAS